MIRSSERSRGSYRSFAVLSASPIVLVRPTTRGLEFMECTACGRIWKQDRGLIDLGCEPETKLRRTHDKGKGVRATPQLLQPESHLLAYTARLVP